MLIAYQVGLELVAELRPLVEQIRKHDNTLAKQLVDAMNSTVQNLAEGEAHPGTICSPRSRPRRPPIRARASTRPGGRGAAPMA